MKPENGGGGLLKLFNWKSVNYFLCWYGNKHIIQNLRVHAHTSYLPTPPPFPVLSQVKQNWIENIQIIHKILVRVSFLIWRCSVPENVPFWLWLHIG